MENRIIKALSGFYYVATAEGVVECRARGRFRKEGISPLVGDFVTISRSGKSGTVEEILPRRSMMERPSVANVDMLMLVIASVPQPDMLLCDKLIRATTLGMKKEKRPSITKPEGLES